jgi:hypothetical protein
MTRPIALFRVTKEIAGESIVFAELRDQTVRPSGTKNVDASKKISVIKLASRRANSRASFPLALLCRLRAIAVLQKNSSRAIRACRWWRT